MRAARAVALVLVLTAVGALTIASGWLTLGAWGTFDGIQQGIGFLLYTLNGPAFAAIGALISSRRPGNRIGYLALMGGLTLAASSLGSSTIRYAEQTGDPRALPLVFSRLSDGGWLASVTVIFLFLQLFPNGRSLSSRWRLLAVATIGWAVVMLVLPTFARYTFSGSRITGLNPTAIPGVVGDALTILAGPLFLLLPPLAALSLLSLVIRFRRASEVERAQLKWFVATALFGIGLLSLTSVAPLGGWGVVLANIGFLGIPVAIGVAILRYRLYDIDVLINRTVVYLTVTATLIGTYAAAVLLLRQLLGQFVFGNDLVIAASTLLIAALFQPVRHRVQALVDRRFYRRKYDAAKTVAAFSAHLRQDIDLDSIVGELTAVAREAVQPAHASVWLRGRAK